MAKINLLLIQSINGSIDDSVNDLLWSHAPSAADAKKFIKLAAQELTEEYLLSSLINDDSDDIFLLEVHSESATLASILLSLGMVNKVIVYTVPVFVATNHLPFVGLLRDNQLMCEETNEEVIESCKKAALKTDFNYNSNVRGNQQGTITYTFTAKK